MWDQVIWEIVNVWGEQLHTHQGGKAMTGTTAKAQLVDLLLDPLRGCTGLYTYRQELIQQVMRMPAMEAKERLDHLRQTNHPGS